MSVAAFDHTLVLRAQAGDADAVTTLAEEARPAMERYATRLVRDRARAEDLAQMALTKALSRVADVRSPAAFPAWLRTITRNECLNELSRHRPEQVPLSVLESRGVDLEAPAGGDHDPEEALSRQQLAEVVRRVAGSLPRHYRLTLTMRALEDLPYSEISARLGVPVPLARLWYCRARQHFRTAFIEAISSRRGVPDACRRLAGAIAELVAGSLDAPDLARLRGHLLECEVCRQTEADLRDTAFGTPIRGILAVAGGSAGPVALAGGAGRVVVGALRGLWSGARALAATGAAAAVVGGSVALPPPTVVAVAAAVSPAAPATVLAATPALGAVTSARHVDGPPTPGLAAAGTPHATAATGGAAATTSSSDDTDATTAPGAAELAATLAMLHGTLLAEVGDLIAVAAPELAGAASTEPVAAATTAVGLVRTTARTASSLHLGAAPSGATAARPTRNAAPAPQR